MIALSPSPKSSHLPAGSNTEGGFTLLEVLIALGIMAVAFGSILNIEMSSIQGSRRAADHHILVMLARNKVLETEVTLEGQEFSAVKTEDSGRFSSPYEAYRWKTEIKELELPNLQLQMNPEEGEEERTQNSANNAFFVSQIKGMVTKYLSESIREVVITIFWGPEKDPRQMQVSFFWVNLALLPPKL